MKRQPNTQDIAWFLDLNTKRQLDLDPPYQRRSVWTPKDRTFFLDSVLRNFPTAPIFLHKSREDTGETVFHVVDGKQRLETILMFSQDKIRAPKAFGDASIDNKQFSDLPAEVRNQFWDYVLTVEMVDATEGTIVNDIFDRLNRNARSLTRQELRHARFEGEFTKSLEAEADDPFWAVVGISTRTRARRMRDVEFMAELWLLTAHGAMATTGDRLDEFFAEYDEEIPNYEETKTKFDWAKAQVGALQDLYNLAQSRFRNFADFYGLFGAILEHAPKKIDPTEVAQRLQQLEHDVMVAQRALSKSDPLAEGAPQSDSAVALVEAPQDAAAYLQAIRGASNDLKERRERIAILVKRCFEGD